MSSRKIMEEIHNSELEKVPQTKQMQCEMCIRKNKKEARKSLLTKVIDYENFKKITEERHISELRNCKTDRCQRQR